MNDELYWEAYANVIKWQRDESRKIQGEIADKLGKERKKSKSHYLRYKNAIRKLERYTDKMRKHADKEVRSCVRKRKFTSRAAAQCYLEIHSSTKKMVIYPCKYCDGHHLATNHKPRD